MSKGLSTKEVKKRNKGPFSTEKNNNDFEMLRNAKLIKIDLFTEKCRVCEQIFSSETLANKHVRKSSCFKVNTKNKQPMKDVFCESCSESFSSRRKLKEHDFLHHTSKKYECTECNKSFKRRYDWQRHNREKHEANASNVFKHICDSCDYSTPRFLS